MSKPTAKSSHPRFQGNFLNIFKQVYVCMIFPDLVHPTIPSSPHLWHPGGRRCRWCRTRFRRPQWWSFGEGMWRHVDSSHMLSLRIQSPCQMMIGVYNHLLRKVFRFHYHSQKVIGSLGSMYGVFTYIYHWKKWSQMWRYRFHNTVGA